MERVNVRRLPADWGPDEEALLTRLDDATATPVQITYRLAPEWFDGVAWVLDDLEDFAAQRPEVALVLCEHLLVRLDRALPNLDDSDGGMTACCDRLLALHRGLAGEHAERRLRALGNLELLA